MKKKRRLPWIVKALSIGLILAPFGNFFFSAYLSGVQADMSLLGRVPWLDWVWNGLLALSGVMILLRRKLSWLVAIVSILICTAINFYKFMVLPEAFGLSYQVFALTTSIIAVIIVGYFRYPYLDRRDRWIAFHRRHVTSLPAVLDGHPAQVTVKDLSLSGAQLECRDPSGLEPDQSYPLEISGYKFKIRVVWMNGTAIGVEFEDLSRELKARIADWIKQA